MSAFACMADSSRTSCDVRNVPRSDINLSGHPKDDLSYNSKPRGSYLQPGGAQKFGLVGHITDWITDTARRPTRVLAWGLETDFYGSQLLIHKLVPGIRGE